jgi:hypothetical protein
VAIPDESSIDIDVNGRRKHTNGEQNQILGQSISQMKKRIANASSPSFVQAIAVDGLKSTIY